MQIYIQDRSESTVATIGDFYEDMHKTLTSTGTGSYEFTVSKSEPGQEFLNVGNYVVLLDEQNKGHQFTITKVDQLHDEKTVYAEDASLQLLSKEARPWAKVAKAQPASYYFNKALKGTGWVIGVNQIANLTRTLEWTGWDTVLTRLLSIATEFDNAELDFHVELDRTNVVRKVVDIYKQVGAYRDDIQLVYGDTANDIQKTESTENFATAIEGIGSLVENTKEGEPEKHYNFSAIGYDDGDFYSPKGDPKLYSRKAHEKWDGKYGYSERHFDYETKDPQELLNRSKTELKKRCEPEVNYEISIADGRLIDINKGDTVKIFDHTYNPELLLQARAIEVDKSYTDPSQNKAIFGNFLTLISNVDPRLLEIQKQISQLPKARTPYPWVRYADDDKGTGMSMFPAGKAYMATVWNYETAVPSDNPIDYAGKWIKVKGEDGQDGSNGVPGPKGADGQTSYFHTAWADSADGTDGFYVGGGDNLLTNAGDLSANWIEVGSISTTTGYNGHPSMVFTASTRQLANQNIGLGKLQNSTQYTASFWAKAANAGDKAHTELWGSEGKTDFVLTTNWVRYTAVVTSQSDANTNINHSHCYFGVPAGNTGNVYIAEPKLELGTTATPWSPAPEEAHPIYMGTYTDFTQADSLDPSAYTWSLIKGADGKDGNDGLPGKDGLGIKSTVIDYQLSSSGTTQPTGIWTSTVPAVTKGQYLWTRTDWTYTDNSTETGYSVSYIAKDGNNGTNGVAGKDGVGIKTTTITYASSISGTTAPTSGWTANPPATSAGHYIWTKTVWAYTDGTSETGYSVGKIGDVGPKGDTGDRGLQGLQGATGNQGIQGPKGADGKSSYTHIAYATSSTGDGFSQTSTATTTYVGMYVDSTATDSTDTAKYKWTLIKGADGSQGTPGKPGTDGKTPYLHTAYSWSADGTDRFMTVYPGENLVTGTSKELKTITISGWGASPASPASGTYGSGKYYASVYIENTTPFGMNIYVHVNGHVGNFIGNTIPAGQSGIASCTFDILEGQSLDSAWVGFTSEQTERYTYKYKELMVKRMPSPWTPSPLDDPEGAYPQFIGTYTDYTTEDSTDPAKYTWAKLRGEQGPKGDTGKDGIAGKDGVGIKSTLIQYASNTSGTVAPTSGWATTIPAALPGHYVWTKYTWTYTDGTTEAGYSVGKIGETGQTGQKGDTGPRGSTGATGAKGATGSIGPQGPKGDPGSKDVPVTTLSAAQPTTAKNGDIWWVLNSADVATAMKVYTSGAWVDKKVDQSVLNIVTLNAVEINGSTINGSEFNTSYTGTLVDGVQGSSQQTLDKYGYSQTSTIPWFSGPIVTRSEITNTGGIMMGYSKQSKYNPSHPWDNTEGSIYLDPINLNIGFTGADRSGDYYLSVQDAYQNSGSATYLNGWGSWNADYSLKVIRQGRMVTVWGYIKHNNSATITPFAQVPAWARPEQGILISAVTFNSKVDNPIASALVMNAETGKIGFNSGGQKGGYVCFSTTYVGGYIVS